MEKLDKPLDAALDVVVVPHGFEVTREDPEALLQSMPELCVEYDGVIAGVLFMLIPIVGLDCCCDVVPIPGLLGVRAGKEEFNEFIVLSGVMVLLLP
jgi:hypothetical protein